jgi:hypothetical protein
MNEHDARQVVLVKSFEAQGMGRQLLSDAERRHATRAALETVGASGTPEAFIAARARVAIDSVTRQAPVVKKLLQSDGWNTTWLLLAIVVGLLLGITADVFGSGRELNLLAPPAWLVIAWNLGVYVVLCARFLGAGAGNVLPETGWIARSVRSLMDFRFRRSTTAVAASGSHASALADFGVAWTRASLPLTTARLSTLLHTASAAVAIALIAGMYLRGIALEYRVGWSSTFLQAETVHSLLSFLLAPAVCLSGIQLPDIAQMEALRDASSLSREQASAAPWIHLYAVMLILVVVMPRTLLALWSRWRAQRLAAHFPLSLDDSYYRGLLRVQRGEATRVHLLPYGQSLSENAEQHLRNALAQAFDDSPAIELAPTTTLGAEDDLGTPAPALAHATHLVAVFDMVATPEAECHGAFLTALQAAVKVPVIVVVNESGFATRFRDYPQRLGERREAWSRFARSVAKRAQFLDLENPQTSANVSELKTLIDELAEPRHG